MGHNFFRKTDYFLHVIKFISNVIQSQTFLKLQSTFTRSSPTFKNDISSWAHFHPHQSTEISYQRHSQQYMSWYFLDFRRPNREFRALVGARWFPSSPVSVIVEIILSGAGLQESIPGYGPEKLVFEGAHLCRTQYFYFIYKKCCNL